MFPLTLRGRCQSKSSAVFLALASTIDILLARNFSSRGGSFSDRSQQQQGSLSISLSSSFFSLSLRIRPPGYVCVSVYRRFTRFKAPGLMITLFLLVVCPSLLQAPMLNFVQSNELLTLSPEFHYVCCYCCCFYAHSDWEENLYGENVTTDDSWLRLYQMTESNI